MSLSLRIKKLNETIKKNGFEYKLIERCDTKAIYQQEDVAFEVFKIKLVAPHPKAIEDVNNFDKVERFPRDEDFGMNAWTYPTLEQAQKRYASI